MRTIEFTGRGFSDFSWLLNNERRFALKATKLINEATRTPFDGTGKPEPLSGNLSGYWSRRISGEHRLIYSVSETVIRVIACRGHYD
jgi:toxin YoeB